MEILQAYGSQWFANDCFYLSFSGEPSLKKSGFIIALFKDTTRLDFFFFFKIIPYILNKAYPPSSYRIEGKIQEC